MFAFIEGRLAEVNPASAVISTHGVGYHIHITLQTYSKIKDSPEAKLFTHFVVREDAMLLYGFAEKTELQVFEQLISVSGVGPNTARLILSSLSASEVADAINTGNVTLLQGIKGIGAKSAQRILVDLRGKMGSASPQAEIFQMSHNTATQEALSALIMLGFNKAQAEKALGQVARQEGVLPVDKMVKGALKIL